MVKRIKGIGISSADRRRAKKLSREEISEDMELYLYSMFKAEQINDAELMDSAKKDLAKMQRALLWQVYSCCDKNSDVGIKEKV